MSLNIYWEVAIAAQLFPLFSNLIIGTFPKYPHPPANCVTPKVCITHLLLLDWRIVLRGQIVLLSLQCQDDLCHD